MLSLSTYPVLVVGIPLQLFAYEPIVFLRPPVLPPPSGPQCYVTRMISSRGTRAYDFFQRLRLSQVAGLNEKEQRGFISCKSRMIFCCPGAVVGTERMGWSDSYPILNYGAHNKWFWYGGPNSPSRARSGSGWLAAAAN